MAYLKLAFITLLSFLFSSCESVQENPFDQKKSTLKATNKGYYLVQKMGEKTGSYQDLLNLKDVVFDYTYRTPDNKEDNSIESYIFNGELSQGIYLKHERTLPTLKGELEQGYDGSKFWVKINGKNTKNTKAIKNATFLRKTNFYWFSMMQKLLDPSLNYEYLGRDSTNTTVYEIVKITFSSTDTLPRDIYQLYINPKTDLVEQFLFTVVSKNVNSPLLMRVKYESINGVLLPTYRKYTKSDWKANVINDVWTEEISKNIKFNQGLDYTLFKG
jgi:hypothetical protein